MGDSKLWMQRTALCGTGVFLSGLLLAGCATPPAKVLPPTPTPTPTAAQTAPAAAAASRPRRAPYVDAASFDILALLPPAPLKGSVRYEADRRMFRETRRFKDTPRWVMATRDADASTADMLQHFSCALDIEITAATAPRISQLAQNLSGDAGRLAGGAKDHYQRLRPYWIDRGEICRPRDELGKSFDYPSGHTIAGWSWAIALAQIAPDRATPLLARGRAYGESRIVCGVHNATAVEAGRLGATAAAVLAQGNAQYQIDLAAARTEYASLRQSAPHPDAARCAAEAALVALPLD
jgi:acid phosphatase (class A)